MVLTEKPGDAVKMVVHRSSVAGRRRRTWCRRCQSRRFVVGPTHKVGGVCGGLDIWEREHVYRVTRLNNGENGGLGLVNIRN